MEIRPVGARLFLADSWTDGHEDLIVAFRNFTKARKNEDANRNLTARSQWGEGGGHGTYIGEILK
jgi:hypothetical protein